MHEAQAAAGWLIDGFQTMVLLTIWSVAVLAYGLFWRSMGRPQPDPIRPAGPLDER